MRQAAVNPQIPACLKCEKCEEGLLSEPLSIVYNDDAVDVLDTSSACSFCEACSCALPWVWILAISGCALVYG